MYIACEALLLNKQYPLYVQYSTVHTVHTHVYVQYIYNYTNLVSTTRSLTAWLLLLAYY